MHRYDDLVSFGFQIIDDKTLIRRIIAQGADRRRNREYNQQNNVTNGDSLTKSIDDLDTAVGDVSKLNATAQENEHNAHHADVNNVVDALLATEAKVDTMIRRDGGSNSESTIIHLGRESIQVDEATGDFSLNGTDAIRTISALDGSFQDVATMDYVNTHLDGISNQLDDLTDELRTNLAANNAMSALVPNARSRGNTQVSFGTGGYRDAVGVAAACLVSPAFADVALASDNTAYFQLDSAMSGNDAAMIAKTSAQDVQAVECARRLLVGHTDEYGTEEYNMGLGMRRADSVKYLFLKQGFADSNVLVQSVGESEPLSGIHAQNRAVAVSALPRESWYRDFRCHQILRDKANGWY